MFRIEEWGLREHGANPCLGIAMNPRKRVARAHVAAFHGPRKPDAFLFPGYAHLSDAHLVEAAERVRSLVAEAMNLESAPPSRRTRVRLAELDWL